MIWVNEVLNLPFNFQLMAHGAHGINVAVQTVRLSAAAPSKEALRKMVVNPIIPEMKPIAATRVDRAKPNQSRNLQCAF
jgi:hypothetical protein